MKAVSGKTWVQKAVFLEPKPLFSSAFTMWSRGWYLCMEFRMIWARGEGEDIPWEWRGHSAAHTPPPAARGRGEEEEEEDRDPQVLASPSPKPSPSSGLPQKG